MVKPVLVAKGEQFVDGRGEFMFSKIPLKDKSQSNRSNVAGGHVDKTLQWRASRRDNSVRINCEPSASVEARG